MVMERRRRLRQTVTLEILERAAPRLRAQAVKMPPGYEREIVLRKLREVEMACGPTDWLNSPELQPLSELYPLVIMIRLRPSEWHLM
jgi:hypothetical protein